MKPAIYDASAREHSGEPSPVRHWNGNRHDRSHRPGITEVERQIAGLANQSMPDLRVAWRQLHHTGPPLGLSRDLLMRALANQLQERSYGSLSRALRRRLRSLARASERTARWPSIPVSCSRPARPWCASGADALTLSFSTKTGSSWRRSPRLR